MATIITQGLNRMGLTNNPNTLSLSADTINETNMKFVCEVDIKQPGGNSLETIRLEKSPTFGANQYFDVSKVVGNYVNSNFDGTNLTETNLNGLNLIKYSIKYGEKYDGPSGEVENLTSINDIYILLDGSLDRNVYNNKDLDAEFLSSDPETNRFLTDITTRYVTYDDLGTLSTFNSNILNDLNKYPYGVSITTYDKNDNLLDIRALSNTNYTPIYLTSGANIVEFPLYPANINQMAANDKLLVADIFNSLDVANVLGVGASNFTQVVLNTPLPDEIFVGNIVWISDGTSLNKFTTAITSVSPGTNSFVTSIPYDASMTFDVTAFQVIDNAPLITEDVKYYDVKLSTFSGVTYTTEPTSPSSDIAYRFNLFNQCNKFGAYQFAYKNSYGVFDFLTVRGKKSTSHNIERSGYKKSLGSIDNNGYSYSNEDFETTNFRNVRQTSFEISTDWLNEADNVRVLEMLDSVQVYEYIDNVWTPTVVTVNEFNELTKKNNRLIRYNLTSTNTYNKTNGKL